MGYKTFGVYIKKEGATKNAFFFEKEDTVEDIKKDIITRLNYSAPDLKKKKQLCKEERSKIALTYNGFPLTDEKATIEALEMKENDLLEFTLTEDLW